MDTESKESPYFLNPPWPARPKGQAAASSKGSEGALWNGVRKEERCH